jgi:hypothetical protein
LIYAVIASEAKQSSSKFLILPLDRHGCEGSLAMTGTVPPGLAGINGMPHFSGAANRRKLTGMPASEFTPAAVGLPIDSLTANTAVKRPGWQSG